MEIRRATIHDAPAVCACCVAAFKDYIPLIGQTPGPMLEDYCEALKNHHLFVGMEGDTLLGFTLIKDGEGDIMWLDVLASWPKGQGTGKTLLAFSEDFIRQQGKKECRIYTHVKYVQTQQLYLHRGYEIYDRIQEKGFDRYYLKKDLTKEGT